MKAGNSDKDDNRIRISMISLLAFACGATNDISFGIIGDVYVVELIIVPFALLLLLLTRNGGIAVKTPIFWWFMLAGLITLIGYMLSDLIVGTEQWQYLRGWGRVVLMISSCASLMILAAQHRQNLWWFVLGMGVGGVVTLAASGVPIHVWKIGYGERVALILLILVGVLPRWLGLIITVAFGVLNIFLDYRILGGASFAVATVIWARSARPGASVRSFMHYSRFIAAGAAVSILLIMVLLYTMNQYSERREGSNVGRMAAITVSLSAIAESPIIGYGSWTVNEKFARILQQEIQKETDEGSRKSEVGGNIFRAHSQLLQAWVEGGVFGAVFFIFYGFTLAKALRWHALIRPLDKYTPVFLYLLVFGFWNLLASPFGGGQRILIALAVAVIATRSFEPQAKRRTQSLDAEKTDDSSTLIARRGYAAPKQHF